MIVEDGTHNELLALKGRYHEMITAGNLDGDDDDFQDDVEIAVNVRRESVPKITGKQMFDKNVEENHFRDLPKDMEGGQDKPENILYGKALKRILSLSRPEWFIMFLATVSAFLIGASLPAFAVLFAEVYGV